MKVYLHDNKKHWIKDDVYLKPGENEFSDKDWVELQKHSWVAHLVSGGYLGTEKGKQGSSISSALEQNQEKVEKLEPAAEQKRLQNQKKAEKHNPVAAHIQKKK